MCYVENQLAIDVNEMKKSIEKLIKPSSANGGAFTLGHLPLRRADGSLGFHLMNLKNLMKIWLNQNHLLLALSKENEGV